MVVGEARLHLSEVKHYRNRRVAQEGGGERNEPLRDDPHFQHLRRMNFLALIGRLYMVGRTPPSILPTINLRNLLHNNDFFLSGRTEFPHMAV
jgi:hypothetical protein